MSLRSSWGEPGTGEAGSAPLIRKAQLYGGLARPHLTARCTVNRGVSLLSVCVTKSPRGGKDGAAISSLGSSQFGLGEGDEGGARVARTSRLKSALFVPRP